ncbi:hypothetical protein FB451DRAFT_34149 [Mycena latifolia]|nr:hypothetical protein FB451DRAFT_34149 [Mycena latifolia]
MLCLLLFPGLLLSPDALFPPACFQSPEYPCRSPAAILPSLFFNQVDDLSGRTFKLRFDEFCGLLVDRTIGCLCRTQAIDWWLCYLLRCFISSSKFWASCVRGTHCIRRGVQNFFPPHAFCHDRCLLNDYTD